MDRINVGLIGYGFAGKVFHTPILEALDEFQLKKVVSSRTQEIKQDLPDVEVVESATDLWEDESLDLVVIASPNTTHFDLAKAGLTAGKHIVVDKPFVNQSSDGEVLIGLAEQKKRCLSVYHNRRFDNDFLTLKKCVDEGKLGKVNTYIAHYDRFRPNLKGGWREEKLDGSGLLYDLGAHLIDQALYLFGMPKTIYADLGLQRENSITTDYVHLLLNYNDVKVILHVGSMVAEPGPHFQIHGDKGSFVKYGMDSQEAALIAGARPGAPGWGKDSEDSYGTLTRDQNGQLVLEKIETSPGCYEAYYQAIARAILEGTPLPVTARDALNVIKVIEMAIQSNTEKEAIYLNT